jgi:hypothetical protein
MFNNQVLLGHPFGVNTMRRFSAMQKDALKLSIYQLDEEASCAKVKLTLTESSRFFFFSFV